MLEDQFPKLRESPYRIASPENFTNNCLAWAIGDPSRWWEKYSGSYWLDVRVPDDDGWAALFEMSGYAKTDSKESEPGFEKVAIYTKRGEPTHAAKQLRSGVWSSKLGEGHDIEHETLESLEGDAYGYVAQIMKRPRADWR